MPYSLYFIPDCYATGPQGLRHIIEHVKTYWRQVAHTLRLRPCEKIEYIVAIVGRAINSQYIAIYYQYLEGIGPGVVRGGPIYRWLGAAQAFQFTVLTVGTQINCKGE